ncbi:hypothetical protein FRC04_003217 [Tulasnella sp. 424]|nr:hypothetical protein FRC04_003217 [Tulasnella sp. 424]KAG8966165.1 hypothetical protein FRC05_002789 [Tulasnella sp. 425]
MAPSTFLSRFTSIKGSSNADSNSRHARMASASSIGAGSANGSSVGSPTFTPAKDAPPVPPMPRLVLTTEDLDHSSVHAPATPVSKKSTKGPPSILDGVDVTMSPEEARTSEEDQKRTTGGRRRAASTAMGPIPDIIPPPPLLPAAELNTPTPKSTQRSFTDVPAMPEQPKAPNGALNSRKPGDMASTPSGAGNGSTTTNVASPGSKSLSGKTSNIDLRKAIEGTLNAFSPPSRAGTVDVSEGAGGTRSRSNTQFLSVAPTSDDGASDTASIISASGKKRKKLWKKASTSSFRGDKKGGGSALGAALAASGMSLANVSAAPTTTQAVSVSPERLRQDTQKVKEPTRSFTAISNNFKPRRGSGDTDMDSEGAYDSDSQSGLSFNDRDIPITGFAVASSKRNADFHDLFPDVPDGDYLIEDYGCALQREILVQGRLYISENHMCFHANIFGWVTNFTVPFANVTGLEKRMTAFVIPNAIQVNTTDQKYTFASFLSRDTTFDVMQNIWRLAHPDGPPVSDAASGNTNFEGGVTVLVNGANSSLVQSPTQENGPQGRKSLSAVNNGLPAHKPTQCECGKNKTHYPETVWEAVFPGTPEKIYNLIFASGFMKDFLAKDQGLISLQISDWYPESEGSQLLARTMSYIKPLNGSIGPKQTKCELKEETIHVDFDSYVSTVTTTRTPDVPSGGVFACKTRTCIMWAGPASTKIIVTTGVEWSGRSFIKSIIERSVLDGQRTYHADLERAIRKYISEHPTEFIPEGAPADAAATVVSEAEAPPTSPTGETTPEAAGAVDSRRITERRTIQWALDTFTSAMKLTSQSFWGLVDILQDLLESAPDMPSSGGGNWVWWAVVAFLLVMNLWTWSSLSQSRAREELTQKRFGGVSPVGSPLVDPVQGAERVAAEAVRVFWQGVSEQQNSAWKEELIGEIRALRTEMGRLEERLQVVEGGKKSRPSIEEVD